MAATAADIWNLKNFPAKVRRLGRASTAVKKAAELSRELRLGSDGFLKQRRASQVPQGADHEFPSALHIQGVTSDNHRLEFLLDKGGRALAGVREAQTGGGTRVEFHEYQGS